MTRLRVYAEFGVRALSSIAKHHWHRHTATTKSAPVPPSPPPPRPAPSNVPKVYEERGIGGGRRTHR